MSTPSTASFKIYGARTSQSPGKKREKMEFLNIEASSIVSRPIQNYRVPSVLSYSFIKLPEKLKHLQTSLF